MKIDCFKAADIRKAIFLILFLVFLFFGLEVFAVAECNFDGWNKDDCAVDDIHYTDPSGGSGLDKCEWKAGSTSAMPSNCSDVINWDSACDCKDQTDTICSVTILIGSAGDCNVNGTGACKICFKATDNAGNTAYASASLNIDFAIPTTTIQCNGEDCKPEADWYNAADGDVTVTLDCYDCANPGVDCSGCDKTYYCVDQTDSCDPDPAVDGIEYTGFFTLTTEGINYVRYYSTDIAGNIEPTNSKTIKLDKTGPKSEFTDVATPPDGSTVTTDFDVSVDDWDRPAGVDNSGLVGCYYSIHDSGATWPEKSGETRNCNSDLSFTVIVNPGGASGDCRTIGGTCTVSVYAYDIAGNPGEGQFRIFNIAAVNQPPVAEAGPNKDILETETVTLDGSATDPDGDAMTFEWSCDGGSIDPIIGSVDAGGNAQTIYTPPPVDIDTNYICTLTITDDGGLSDEDTVTVTVKNDELPTVTISCPECADVKDLGDVVSVTVSATDDYGLDQIALQIAGEAHPTENRYYVCGVGEETSCSNPWVITLDNDGTDPLIKDWIFYGFAKDIRNEEWVLAGPIEININQAPALDLIGDKSALEGELLQFTISATDPDGDSLTYSASNLPLGASFVGQTFSWTPAAGQAGSYPGVRFEVTDGRLTDWEEITITVTAANQPPVLDSISVSPDYVKQGDTITVNSIASDPNDGDNIRLECGSSPESNDLCIGDYVSANPSCIFSSPWLDNTTHTIYCRVYDGELYSEEKAGSITSDNTGPTIGAIFPTEAVKDQPQAYTFSVSDVSGADSCILQYVDGNLEGLDITLSETPCYECTASFPYTFFEIGTHTFQVMCDDLVDNVTGRIFDIEVTEFGPLVCDINVPDIGVINQWIGIDVSGSQGAITEVRFASNLTGASQGPWTEGWFNWQESCLYDGDCSSDFNCPTCNKYGSWRQDSKTMIWSFAVTETYEVWAEISDGINTESCSATIEIMECWPGPPPEETNCPSPQGCTHTIYCQPDGTWPDCPIDECFKNTPDSPDCPCPQDRCTDADGDGYADDWADYSDFGNCNDSCTCEPCMPSIEYDSPLCPATENCFNNIDDDGDRLIDCQDPDCPPTITCPICQHEECNALGNYDWTCQPDPAGTDCGDCRECDGSGNCIYLCTGDVDTSCECIDDVCRGCAEYYDPGGPTPGYGFCEYWDDEHYQLPVWSCVEGKCQYDCTGTPPPDCTRYPPEVYILPYHPDGVVAGTPLTYTVEVWNKDAGTECPSSSTFNLTTGGYCTEPSWTCSALPDLTISSNNGYQTTTLTVTSPNSDSPPPKGDKDISVTAINVDSGLFRTGYAIYEILNNPPDQAVNLSPTPTGDCGLLYPMVELEWEFSDPDLDSGDYQSAYRVEIFDELDNLVSRSCDPYLSNPDARCESSSSSDHPYYYHYPYPPNNVSLSFNTAYYWRVKVWDDEGAESNWSENSSFRTEKEWPWPDFSVTPPTQRVYLKERVKFTDESTCYDGPCNFSSTAIYLWDFGDGETSSEQGDTSHVYSETGAYDVTLSITDTSLIDPITGEFASCTSDPIIITVTLPLPEWREIAPF